MMKFSLRMINNENWVSTKEKFMTICMQIVDIVFLDWIIHNEESWISVLQ